MSRPKNLTRSVIHKLSDREMRTLLQELVPAFKDLFKALSKSLEHHEYCGWGDNWERECAVELNKEIEAALKVAKGLNI